MYEVPEHDDIEIRIELWTSVSSWYIYILHPEYILMGAGAHRLSNNIHDKLAILKHKKVAIYHMWLSVFNDDFLPKNGEKRQWAA